LFNLLIEKEMKNKFLVISFLVLTLISFSKYVYAQNAQDSTKSKKKEKLKEGLSFGVLPVLGYNSDIGFQYGLVFNLFNYGDGTLYPEYKYSLYTEVSRTTKGGGINQIFFDSNN